MNQRNTAIARAYLRMYIDGVRRVAANCRKHTAPVEHAVLADLVAACRNAIATLDATDSLADMDRAEVPRNGEPTGYTGPESLETGDAPGKETS